MKQFFKRFSFLFTFSLLLLAGCATNSNDNVNVKNDSTTHLNISQAKLIANATDNMK